MTGARPQQTEEAAHERGLAGAILPNDGDIVARTDVERDTSERAGSVSIGVCEILGSKAHGPTTAWCRGDRLRMEIQGVAHRFIRGQRPWQSDRERVEHKSAFPQAMKKCSHLGRAYAMVSQECRRPERIGELAPRG